VISDMAGCSLGISSSGARAEEAQAEFQ